MAKQIDTDIKNGALDDHIEVRLLIPQVISFTSGGREAELDLRKVPADKLPDLIAIAAEQGFCKAGVDAAAGAKAYAAKNEAVKDEAEARDVLMAKRIATWESGEWASRGGGAGGTRATPEAVERRGVLRELMRPDTRTAYAALADAKLKAEFLDGKYEALSPAAKKKVDAVVAERMAAKAQSADIEI